MRLGFGAELRHIAVRWILPPKDFPMTSVPKAPGVSPEVRAGLFHFTVFASTGVASAYFGIWLARRGIPADQVGVVNALPTLVLLAINVLVGRLADKADDWRQVILVLALLAGTIPFALFFVSGFWGILLIWTLAVVPAFSLVPVIDAATLRMTQRNGTDFGLVRAWGTVGYAVTAAFSGPVIAWLGEAAFLPLFVAFAVLRALIAVQLPRFRAPKHELSVANTRPQARHLREVLKPWFVLPLIGSGMLYATHGTLSAFGSLVWSLDGISEGLIGPLIGVAAASEALMMFFWTKLGWTLPARKLIIFAAIVAAARWTIMAFNPPVILLFFLQALHCITFAVGYFGAIHFIANWTSEDIAAEAQGFSYVLSQGMTVVTLLVFGWLVAVSGDKAYLFAAAMCVLGAGLVWISLRLRAAHGHPAEGTE
jgi:MFS transporter, PPP family, 3-phenylpropionic acid transporter